MEQTYISIAMFNRNLKRYSESLAMWKELEALQVDNYGEDSIVLLFTWKNIGTCYMGLGKSEDARTFMNKAMALMEGIMKDSDSNE
jgi:tetratricopeptide (TPR) repeat protein